MKYCNLPSCNLNVDLLALAQGHNMLTKRASSQMILPSLLRMGRAKIGAGLFALSH
jgi:hypothetical protein